MVGKKTTLRDLRQLLHELNVPVVRSMEFTQGKTQRWGIAWSFAAPKKRALAPIGHAAFASTGAGVFAAPDAGAGEVRLCVTCGCDGQYALL